VVVFFVLGGLAYALNFAVRPFVTVTVAPSAAGAESQTSSAYAVLRQQAQAFDTQVSACRTLSDPSALAQCYESNDARFASGLQTYSGTIASIDYPAGVAGNVSAVQSAVGQASSTLTRLSQQGSDLTKYVAAVGSSNVVSELNDVTTTTNQLESALVAQATPTASARPAGGS
jgi:hypothetical protein